MSNMLIIEITNPKAKNPLQQLEDLQWIKVLEDSTSKISAFPKRKFRVAIIKEQGKELDEHIEKLRSDRIDAGLE
jgi:hypothetical protein